MRLVLAVPAVLALGCPTIGKDEVPATSDTNPAALVTVFEQDGGHVPFPTDAILFDAGAGDAGSFVNFGIPSSVCADALGANAAGWDSKMKLRCGLQTLDGFGTYAPISFPVREFLLTDGGVTVDVNALTNPANLIAGILLHLTGTEGAVPLYFDSSSYKSYRNETGYGNVYLKPARPLSPKHKYLAVLTDTVVDTFGGRAITSDPTTTFLKSQTKLYANGKIIHPLLSRTPAGYTDAEWMAKVAYLETLRAQMSPALDGVVQYGRYFNPSFSRQNIVALTVYSTQSITTASDGLAAALASGYLEPIVTKTKTEDPANYFVVDGGNQYGASSYSAIYKVVEGTVALKNYLTNSLGSFDPTKTPAAPALPVGNPTTETAPFVLFLPRAADGGVGVAPYRYAVALAGLGGSRWQTYLFANSIAKAGYATLAIDTLLHGDRTRFSLVDGGFHPELCAPGCTPSPSVALPSLAVLPDGGFIGSGVTFFGSDPFTTRDHFRQAALDTWQLGRAILKVDAGFNNTAVEDTRYASGTSVAAVGVTLGAMVATEYVFLSRGANGTTTPTVNPIVLSVPAGGLVDVIKKNIYFRMMGDIGLANQDAGIVPGKLAYDQTWQTFQWIFDPGDPINYAWALRGNVAGKNILVFQSIDGGSTENPATAGTTTIFHPDTQKRFFEALPTDAGIRKTVCQGDDYHLFSNPYVAAEAQGTLVYFLANPAGYPYTGLLPSTLCTRN